MNLKELTSLLESNKDAALYIMLPTGDFVPEHFHITEVGKVQKDFIDCGGTVRQNIFCSLQTWYASDVEHRLLAGKLADILKLGNKVLVMDDLPVEFEYGVQAISPLSHYILVNVEVTPKGLLFILAGKKTDCLAPDKCGVPLATAKCCTSKCC